MELAVNMPEQQPHPGHAAASMAATSASSLDGSADWTIASIRSRRSFPRTPASIGPPDTKMAGMFSRMAAISIPGVTLSQLLMQTIASALWAFTMYSTLSAMMSREGREYSMPSCPMAMPSSTAMVLNSAAKQPSLPISSLTSCPISCRWVWPGTNCVKELTMAMTGLPTWSDFIPAACQSARAPAILLPSKVIELLNGCFISFTKKPSQAAWTGKVVIAFGRVPYSLPSPGPTRIRTIRDRIIRLHRFISFLLSEGEVTEYNFRKQIIFQTIFLIFSILKKF